MKLKVIAAVCIVGIFALILLTGQSDGAEQSSSPGACFPAKAWSGNDAERPCVELTRIYEDGSFTYKVGEASGTVRYSGAAPTKDR